MAKTIKKDKQIKKEPAVKKNYIYAVGRRKSATARVRLSVDKSGEIIANGLPVEKYFSTEWMKGLYLAPLRACNVIGKFAISIKVTGSGKMGQLDASVLGMSRALAKYDEEKFKPLLRRRGFLSRDPRNKERRKVGTGGKARRQKQSPKR